MLTTAHKKTHYQSIKGNEIFPVTFTGPLFMIFLVLGLIVFLVPHSVGIFAADWRAATKQSMGERIYAGLYSVVSLIGLVLIVYGYGQTREVPLFIWHPSPGLYHVAALLMLVSFIFLAAMEIRNNHFKAAVGHPMLIGIKVWAVAHLLANGRLGDIVLFGVFLIWAVVLFIVLRKRDRLAGVEPVQGTAKGTIITLVAGCVVWVVFAMWIHRWLIGVAPFGAMSG